MSCAHEVWGSLPVVPSLPSLCWSLRTRGGSRPTVTLELRADHMPNLLRAHASGVCNAEVIIWQEEGGSLRQEAAPQCAAKVIKFT